MRLIDADTLKKWLETNKANVNPLDYNTKATYAECITMVEISETIEAEPVRNGRWERYSATMQECSVCKKHTAVHRYKYCPECGAKLVWGE